VNVSQGIKHIAAKTSRREPNFEGRAVSFSSGGGFSHASPDQEHETCIQGSKIIWGRNCNKTFCISYVKSNPLGTVKQINGVQELHNLLCAYYAGREVSEPEGSEESCPTPPSSRSQVVWQKEGHVLVPDPIYIPIMVTYVHALSATRISAGQLTDQDTMF
jgi:hypothetical protein